MCKSGECLKAAFVFRREHVIKTDFLRLTCLGTQQSTACFKVWEATTRFPMSDSSLCASNCLSKCCLRYSVTLDIFVGCSYALHSNHETIIRYVLLECKQKYILCMDGFSTERNNKGMKMKWYELARSRMKELGITQEKLAEELGNDAGWNWSLVARISSSIF